MSSITHRRSASSAPSPTPSSSGAISSTSWSGETLFSSGSPKRLPEPALAVNQPDPHVRRMAGLDRDRLALGEVARGRYGEGIGAVEDDPVREVAAQVGDPNQPVGEGHGGRR